MPQITNVKNRRAMLMMVLSRSNGLPSWGQSYKKTNSWCWATNMRILCCVRIWSSSRYLILYHGVA